MVFGWIITAILALAALFSVCGGGFILSPWYNTLSDEEKEAYSKTKVSLNTGINLAVFSGLLALFLLFLNGNFSDIIKITVSLVFFLFIVFYIVILSKKGLKNCKK